MAVLEKTVVNQNADKVEVKHDSLFITFKVFPLNNNITLFTLHH